MPNYLQLLLVTALVCAFGNAFAELYTWYDEQGIKHITSLPPNDIDPSTPVTIIRYDTDRNKTKSTAVTPRVPRKMSNHKANQKLTPAEEEKIDKEIRATWASFWEAFNRGDIDAASDHHTPTSREKYRQVYKSLRDAKRK